MKKGYLATLQLPSLSHRWLRDLIMLYKILTLILILLIYIPYHLLQQGAIN